jgi:hypothetical protein
MVIRNETPRERRLRLERGLKRCLPPDLPKPRALADGRATNEPMTYGPLIGPLQDYRYRYTGRLARRAN